MAKLPKNTAAAFNEWQRRFIEDPSGFEAEWASVRRTLQERITGHVTYGERCVTYLEHILNEGR